MPFNAKNQRKKVKGCARNRQNGFQWKNCSICDGDICLQAMEDTTPSFQEWGRGRPFSMDISPYMSASPFLKNILHKLCILFQCHQHARLFFPLYIPEQNVFCKFHQTYLDIERAEMSNSYHFQGGVSQRHPEHGELDQRALRQEGIHQKSKIKNQNQNQRAV